MAATIAVPTIGGLLVGLLCQLIPERRPHGPPDAIRAAQSLDGAMPVKAGVVSAQAASISLGVGASVGQYGPLAHIGASVGSWISRIFGNNRYLGTIGIGCGAAAAIATAFNAPIAGLVFAHEVILRHYSLRAFAPITVAATLGYLVANFAFDRPPLFRIDKIAIVSPFEFPGFVFIGIAGAVLATILMKTVLYAAKFAKSLALPAPFKPALAGLMVGIVALQIPEVLGIGKEVLRFAIIENTFTAYELVFVLVAKLVLTAICLGFGFAGGIFSPALLIGILFGTLIGYGVDAVFVDQRSHIALYAICGMVAVTSPVIGAPLTTILIVFELTRNYELATAAMVSVAFANLVGYRMFGRSLFDIQLKMRNFDLSMGRDKVIIERHKVGDFVSDQFTSVPAGASLLEVRDSLLQTGRTEAYTVDDRGNYLGTLSINLLLNDEAQNFANARAEEYAKPEPLILSPEDSLWDAMVKLENFVGESIPVVNDGRLIGVVFEASIVRAYLKVLNEIRAEENAAA
ncbi:MAG: chloride channel protein [Gammaproteobacteria bacterium]|nr:chloride channel protein [Gammaproteobacteria bacterium]